MGPTPWYWRTLPEPTSAGGRRFIWTYHGEQGPVGYLVTLNPRQEPNKTVLALNSYCRAFLIPPGRLGIWCPEAEAGGQSYKSYLRFLCFDPEQLEPFSLNQVAGWFKQSSERVYSATAPLAEFEISGSLAAGDHAIEVPEEFRTVEELLAPTSYPAVNRDAAAAAVYVVQPRAGRVQVLPQKWFTPAKTDFGYQWITRIARDPLTRRLVGDGIRINKFELSEDGCEVAGWIE